MDPTISFCSDYKDPEIGEYPFYYGNLIKKNKINSVSLVELNDDIDEIDSFYSNIEDREIKSIFNDRMGIVMANLDAVFHFTGCLDDFYIHRSYKRFDYNIVNATVGSIQYLQYRSYQSSGHVLFNQDFFDPIEIDDRIEIVDDINKMGIHQINIYLLPPNGKINYEDIKILNRYQQKGGDLIIQIPLSDINYNNLYDIALEYKNIFMIRPVSLRVENDSFFIIYRCKGNVDDYYSPIPGILEIEQLDQYELDPINFKMWLDDGIRRIYKWMNWERTNRKVVDYYKCHLIWNILSY